MGQLSDFVPCLLTSGDIWSQEEERPLIAEELLVCQGVPLFWLEYGLSRYPVPAREHLLSQGQKNLQAFAGNSIHSMVAGALTLCVI